jgi:uncharacterized protein
MRTALAVGRTPAGKSGDPMERLPLFPLSTVLLPRMLMPLYIFEERYKQMLRRLPQEGRFGVALIRTGTEVGGPAQPWSVGTVAEILGTIDLENENKYLIVRGAGRFHIAGISDEDPYLVAQVHPLPLEAGGTDTRLMADVEMEFYRYLRLMKRIHGVSINISNAPDDPEGIAWMVAWGLQVDSQIHQELLMAPSLQELFHMEAVILTRENKLLELLGADSEARGAPPDLQGHFSLN